MFNKLRGTMKERDVDQKYLAEKLDICVMGVSHRLTGKAQWKLSEMYAILDLFQQPHEKLHEYFPKDGIEQPFADTRVYYRPVMRSRI